LELPLDDDNNLTLVTGLDQPAKGRITDLSGRLLLPDGRPVDNVRIEIWQCDINGRYRHPGDTGVTPLDPGFQGHGHTVSDNLGRFRFRTIRPAPYPGRTPHIHVAVFPVSDRPFVTQLYVANDPRNATDFLYNRVAPEQRRLVTTDFVTSADAGSELAASWDIVLGVTPA
jgi:protocatechuate 3,4-dioxygenase beta subunit